MPFSIHLYLGNCGIICRSLLTKIDSYCVRYQFWSAVILQCVTKLFTAVVLAINSFSGNTNMSSRENDGGNDKRFWGIFAKFNPLAVRSRSRSTKPSYSENNYVLEYFERRLGDHAYVIAMRRTQHRWGLTLAALPFAWKHQWFKWSALRFLGPPAQCKQAWLGLQHTRYYQETAEILKSKTHT